MPHVPSVPRARRAGLRRIRAEFEAAFDAVDDLEDRSSPAYLAADARYRAWIRALDAVAIALLDDLDACDPAASEPAVAPGIPARAEATLAEVERLFAELDDVRDAADLLGSAPPAAEGPRPGTPRSRAMGIVGADRAARHWSVSLGADGPSRRVGGAP